MSSFYNKISFNPPPPKDQRKAIGAFGEALACDFLKRRDYEIIERNVKLSYLEIDIVARLKKKISFIEVKTRAEKFLGGANEALKNVQIQRLKRAICAYSIQRKIKLENIGLDFISIDIDKIKKTAKIKHYRDII